MRRVLLILCVLLMATSCSDDTTPADAAPADGPAQQDAGPDAATDAAGVDLLLDSAGTDQPTADGKPTDSKPAPDTAPPDSKPAPDGPVGTGPLRVATFNLHCLLDNPATRAKGIAAEIVKLKPDVVGLQEICQTASSPADNIAEAIAKELKTTSGVDWQVHFAKTHLSWSKYDEGVGLMAPKGTITASGASSLPQGKGPFPRKVAWAKLSTSRGAFYLYSTHLTISSDATDRLNQAKAILTLVNSHASSGASLPQVVVGDFNDWYGSSAVNQMKSGPPAFTESWGTKHPGSANPGLTCCYPSFASRIDYVFVKSSALKSLDTVSLAFDKAYSGVQLSDHRGLYVEFTPK